MPDLGAVEDTLFVPMLGRIYATEHFPSILDDPVALSLKDKLPHEIKGSDTQTQYTLLASAVRSSNMDRYIRDFLSRKPNGVIAQIGCGLETTFFRNDNGKNVWFEIDLPDVIAYRTRLLPSSERDRYIAADAFEKQWIDVIREEYPHAPILVTASGLFYYFEKTRVIGLLRMLKGVGNIEVVFDAVSSRGIKRMSKYMKQVGHEDVSMYFSVDRGEDLLHEFGETARVIAEENYYAHTDTTGLKLGTRLTMKASDLLRMVKMVHLNL